MSEAVDAAGVVVVVVEVQARTHRSERVTAPDAWVGWVVAPGPRLSVALVLGAAVVAC